MKPLPSHLSRAEARRRNLTVGQIDDRLQRRIWTAPLRGLYATGDTEDFDVLCRAVQEGLPDSAAYSHLTALRLAGLPITRPPNRLEIAVPRACAVDSRRGLRVHHLLPRPHTWLRGLRVVELPWAIGDVACRDGVAAALVPADAALREGLSMPSELAAAVAAMGKRKGIVAARRVAELADGRSESPRETRLRLLLADAGLPAPEPQLVIWLAGGLHYRADLGWPAARLLVEYDGRLPHERRWDADTRRQNALQAAGWLLLRYVAEDLAQWPDRIVAEVAAALAVRLPLAA